jgi:hypothetical protein
VLHVRAGGGPGGSGTADAPFGTIAEAVAAAVPGSVIALGRGRFAEAVALPAGVTLWGACVAETEVACPVPSESSGTLAVGGADTEVRNLRVGGSCHGIRVGGADAALRLDDVVIAGAMTLGLRVGERAALSGRNVVVRDTQPDASDGAFGRGLQASARAQVDLGRVSFERNGEGGVTVADEGTGVRLSDVAIRDTACRPSDGQLGRGIHLQDGRVEV